MGYIIYSVSEMCMKKSLLRINHPDIEDLSTGAVPTKKFSIRMQFVSLGKISYTF